METSTMRPTSGIGTATRDATDVLDPVRTGEAVVSIEPARGSGTVHLVRHR
jgi:hypothetical protein